MDQPLRRVLIDGEPFLRHHRSGIARYLSELVAVFRGHPGFGFAPVTPYRFVANAQLAERLPGSFRTVHVPSAIRYQTLNALNALNSPRRSKPRAEAEIVHHALHAPAGLERWYASRRVVTLHDFAPELYPHLFANPDEDIACRNLFIRHADVLVCVSETTRRDLYKLHPELDKPVVVAPLGVSAEFFDPPLARLPPLPDRFVLYVGNRHPHKNADLLFQAFARLAQGDTGLRLVLCGRHPTHESARLRELGIEGQTMVLQPTDIQLAWIYRFASVFVFPSRYEGFGLPVLEAMAAGCPTIVADTPALVEVAEDSALIVRADDVDGLASSIERVINDRECARMLSRSGVRRSATFSWRRTARSTAEAYALAAER